MEAPKQDGQCKGLDYAFGEGGGDSCSGRRNLLSIRAVVIGTSQWPEEPRGHSGAAPFRVLQNLETDTQVGGLMDVIRRHLAPSGRAILNTFCPNRSADELRRHWCVAGELADGETALPSGGRLVRSDRRPRIQSDPLVLYPELIYRRYSDTGALEDEAVLKISMRCWYPAELEALVAANGFRTTARWGGYCGEAWGEGSELVIEFERDAQSSAPH
jgi:hypothetical protein